ncbi:hypothetical protein B5V00_12535 [Geothermobacter hydrogeniphilus]|uniref:PpiC domain-containing protein n=2 Tax=Geothermobacter hydrogeniphilus TaxID=1969733 RepID=A0A1X0XZC2_9BACT|nr:hypothetical protein B5V00_12535 [Geothermobacter hydrogeniphilus]
MVACRAEMKVFRVFNRLLFFSILLAMLLSGCREEGPGRSPVLLRVDGREVTLARFNRSFERTLPGEEQLSPEQRRTLRRSYLGQVVDRELALAEADRLNVVVTPSEVEQALEETTSDYTPQEFERLLREQDLSRDDWRRRLAEGMRIEKVIALAAYSGVRVSESEVAAYYKKHRDQFKRPQQVRARQLVVAERETGERLLGRLRQGEDFADLARRYSLSPDGEQGGDLGWFARGQMPPEFDAVVFKLAVGRISDLVKSPYGYHLFLVEERRPAKKLKLEEAAPEIRKELQREAEQRAYQAWLVNLRKRAEIEVNLDLLNETDGD